jgi:hypothetical protein
MPSPTKEPQRAAPVATLVELLQNHFDIWHTRKGAWCFSRSGTSTTPCRRPRDDVAASQPEARGGCCLATTLLRAPMQVHSHRRVRAPAAAQPRRNEQALPVERLCKFYSSGDMSESVPVSVTQGFHTVNRAYLPCSLVSLVSRNSSRAAKPR